ncbi:copper resistance protein NlpE [Pontibacter ruber]|uniref:Copper resistance protein NlpE n=1 Tax=Pontibacter ruber TaxID=1343895 RepID=A0ABW5D078_9BACT|nr:copper resistance protein NlpE [Pontibacter ruber]
MKTLSSLFLMAALFVSVSASAQSSYEAWRKSAGKKAKTTETTAKATTTSTKAAKSVKTSAKEAAIAAPAGFFSGTVPCADCEGIKMELNLNGSPKGQGRTFTLKQTYLGKPAGKNNTTSNGTWFLAKGNHDDPNVLILQLIPKGNYEPIYFQQLSGSELKMLDRKQNAIKSKHNYNLKKQ